MIWKKVLRLTYFLFIKCLACIYRKAPYADSAHGDQKRASDSPSTGATGSCEP